MLPAKLRSAKVQGLLLVNRRDIGFIASWRACQVARGVIETMARWLDGKKMVQVDDLDAAIIRSACHHLGLGGGLAFDPFHGGAALCGNVMAIPAKYLESILSLEKRD